jgi:small subunit ribosomal protein S21
MRVEVHDNKVDEALRVLRRKMLKEGILKELRRREFYEPPSARRRREHAAAVARARKAERKRLERDGF